MKWPLGDREEAWVPDSEGPLGSNYFLSALWHSWGGPCCAYGHPPTFSWGHLSALCNSRGLRTSLRLVLSASAPGSSGGTLILPLVCISISGLELRKGATQPAFYWPLVHLLWGVWNQIPPSACLARAQECLLHIWVRVFFFFLSLGNNTSFFTPSKMLWSNTPSSLSKSF